MPVLAAIVISICTGCPKQPFLYPFSERTQVKQHDQIWQTWADTLTRWGVKDLTATILEAMGPLSLLAAQLVYVGQPVLAPFFRNATLEGLADMLEDPQETQAFIAVLRHSDQAASASSSGGTLS
jgi:hypothetical protein